MPPSVDVLSYYDHFVLSSIDGNHTRHSDIHLNQVNVDSSVSTLD